MTTTTQRTVATIVTKSGLSIYLDGKSHVIAREHPRFKEVVQALKDKQYDELADMLNPTAAVSNYLSPDPDFTIEGGTVVLNGEPFDISVSAKVLRMMDEGIPVQPILNFLRKVRNNPSNSAQRELLLFCEANEFMIHEDGSILAYKAVRRDYTDMHSGRFLNTIGQVVSMARGAVDDRRDVTCSHGLHFAAFEYAKNFGAGAGHVMVLKIDPADVVSIPSDYNNQKGRCCKYEVIAEREDFTPLAEKEVYEDRDFTNDGEEDDYYEDEDLDEDETHIDAGKTANQLKAEYVDEHADYTRDEWRADEDTDLGYWQWVVEQIAAND